MPMFFDPLECVASMLKIVRLALRDTQVINIDNDEEWTSVPDEREPRLLRVFKLLSCVFEGVVGACEETC